MYPGMKKLWYLKTNFFSIIFSYLSDLQIPRSKNGVKQQSPNALNLEKAVQAVLTEKFLLREACQTYYVIKTKLFRQIQMLKKVNASIDETKDYVYKHDVNIFYKINITFVGNFDFLMIFNPF